MSASQMLSSFPRRLLPVAVSALFLLAATVAFAQEHPQSGAPTAFFTKHCVRCHGPEKQEANLRVDTLDVNFATGDRSADAWVEVLDRINLGEMPPEDEPRPTPEELESVVTWITGQLQELRHRAVSSGGRVLLRRLTRTEYANTVRDLLGVEFPEGEGPQNLLPPDGSISGFTKVSKGLLLDPSLMEKYVAVAELVASRSVRVRPPLVPSRTMRFEFENKNNYQTHSRAMQITPEGLILYSSSIGTGYELLHPFNGKTAPVTGRYHVRVRAGADVGERGEPIYMDFRRGQQGRLQRFRVEASLDQPQVYEFTGTLDATIPAEISVAMLNGIEHFENNFVGRASSRDDLRDASQQNENLRNRALDRAEGITNRPNLQQLDLSKAPKLYLDYIEVEGPLNGPWPPPSMSIVFPGYPNSLTKENETVEYARTVFERLLPRTYRRPVTRGELDRVVGLVERELRMQKPFHEAIRVGIVGMLCTPQFLHLFEERRIATSAPELGNGPRSLTDHELATRLSYFLWSSMPDDALFRLAESGELRNRQTLSRQIDRMLADGKSEALVDDFAYQWLRIGEFDRFAPDQHIYPDFYNAENAGVGADMRTEPLAVFREVLKTDQSILSFLDADWTMLNERLARFYKINGVTGRQFRRVALPGESPRGGLLGMAGVHKWGADGSRTKPVERGKYLLDVLFNDAPPPPPPNAGEVQPNERGRNLTVSERLAQHREIAACANCHRRIDPYGLGMENFNAIGQWRERQDGEKPLAHWGDQRRVLQIEGKLPNGQAYQDFAQFKQAIKEQSPRFVHGLCEKLLVYALGRPLEASDQPVVDDIVAQTAEGDHTIRAAVKAIVSTTAFQSK